jgi:hypothetical protein
MTAKSRRVGISLMDSADTQAAIEHVAETQPDATIDYRDCFYKVESDGPLTFNMAQLSELAGRDIDTNTFLVNMSSYYGRIVVGEGLIEIHADIQPNGSAH